MALGEPSPGADVGGGEPSPGVNVAEASPVLMLRGEPSVGSGQAHRIQTWRPMLQALRSVACRNGRVLPYRLLHVAAHFESLTSIRAFESFDWNVVFENFDPAWRSTACAYVCGCG